MFDIISLTNDKTTFVKAFWMHNLHSYQPHKIDQSLDIKYQNYVFGFDF